MGKEEVLLCFFTCLLNKRNARVVFQQQRLFVCLFFCFFDHSSPVFRVFFSMEIAEETISAIVGHVMDKSKFMDSNGMPSVEWLPKKRPVPSLYVEETAVIPPSQTKDVIESILHMECVRRKRSNYHGFDGGDDEEAYYFRVQLFHSSSDDGSLNIRVWCRAALRDSEAETALKHVTESVMDIVGRDSSCCLWRLEWALGSLRPHIQWRKSHSSFSSSSVVPAVVSTTITHWMVLKSLIPVHAAASGTEECLARVGGILKHSVPFSVDITEIEHGLLLVEFTFV